MKQLPPPNASALPFSVVIPVWNGIAHLAKRLEAVVRGREWIGRDLPMGSNGDNAFSGSARHLRPPRALFLRD